MKEYNTTHLDPETTFNKHVFHRDQFAHYLRWSHILKIMRDRKDENLKVLDYGSGTGALCEVMYRNRLIPRSYVGLEYSKAKVRRCVEKYGKLGWASFYECDIVKPINMLEGMKFDIIASFEVIEHCNKKNTSAYLENLKKFCDKNTMIYISTPCYDEHVGAAQNHIIDGIVQEYTFDEMKTLLNDHGFEIVKVYGTFASTKDYKPFMNDWQKEMYHNLKQYYDNEIMSVLMAPLFPTKSRNCMWCCKIVR